MLLVFAVISTFTELFSPTTFFAILIACNECLKKSEQVEMVLSLQRNIYLCAIEVTGKLATVAMTQVVCEIATQPITIA